MGGSVGDAIRKERWESCRVCRLDYCELKFWRDMNRRVREHIRKPNPKGWHQFQKVYSLKWLSFFVFKWQRNKDYFSGIWFRSVGVKFCLFIQTMIQLMPNCPARIPNIEPNLTILNQRYNLRTTMLSYVSKWKPVWIPIQLLTAVWPHIKGG